MRHSPLIIIKAYHGYATELQSALDPFMTQWSKANEFWDHASLKETLSRSPDQHITTIAIDPKMNIAVAAALFHHVADQADLLFIHTLSEKRQKGYGRYLLEASESVLAGMNIAWISLEVRPSNETARSVYAALGYRQISRRKNYYTDGEDCLVLQKKIHIKEHP